MKVVDTRLFVGGTEDGQRRAVPVEVEGLALSSVAEPPQSQHYNRAKLAVEDTIFWFWVHSELKPSEAIKRMFDHYQPSPPETPPE